MLETRRLNITEIVRIQFDRYLRDQGLGGTKKAAEVLDCNPNHVSAVRYGRVAMSGIIFAKVSELLEREGYLASHVVWYEVLTGDRPYVPTVEEIHNLIEHGRARDMLTDDECVDLLKAADGIRVLGELNADVGRIYKTYCERLYLP